MIEYGQKLSKQHLTQIGKKKLNKRREVSNKKLVFSHLWSSFQIILFTLDVEKYHFYLNKGLLLKCDS